MKALMFSDNFFTDQVFEKIIKNRPFWKDVEKKYFNTGWPKQPFISEGKLKEFNPYPEEALEEARDCEIIITEMGCVDQELINASAKLKLIACLRSGPVNVDVDYATEKKIPVIFAPYRSTKAVAEFTLGLIIALRRHLVRANSNLRKGIWLQEELFLYDVAPPPLEEQQIGFIGFGNIPRVLSNLLKTFGCRMVATDPYVSWEIMSDYEVEKIEMEELLSTSDIISLHVRASGDNENMIGEKEFSLMKPQALFINTARGKLVDEGALFRALSEGKIAGAAIDTFWDEPWKTMSPLADLENVILTPHIAGASRSTAEDGAAAIVNLVEKYFAGDYESVIPFCKNPEVFNNREGVEEQ